MAAHSKRLTLDDEELAKLCTLQAVVKGYIVRRQLAQLRTDYEALTLRLEQQHSNQSIVDWHSEYPCKPHHYIKKYYKKRPVVKNKSSPETKHKEDVDGSEDVVKQVKQNEKASEKKCIGEGSLETCMIPERIRSDVTKGEQDAVNKVQVPESCLETDEINLDERIRASYEDEALDSERSDTASLESVNRTDVLPIEGDVLNQEVQLTDSFQMDGDIQAPEKENNRKIEMDGLIQNNNDHMKNSLKENGNTIPERIEQQVDIEAMDTNNTGTFDPPQSTTNFTDTLDDDDDDDDGRNRSSIGSSKKTEEAYHTQSDQSISDRYEQSDLMQDEKDDTDRNAKLGESCIKMDGPSSIDSNMSNPYQPEDKVDMQASRFGIHNETSVWGSEMSFRGTKNYPTDPEELKKLRNHVAMELLWVQQAIISRKNYLRLKDKIDCKS